METKTQDQPANVAPPETKGGSAATIGSPQLCMKVEFFNAPYRLSGGEEHPTWGCIEGAKDGSGRAHIFYGIGHYEDHVATTAMLREALRDFEANAPHERRREDEHGS